MDLVQTIYRLAQKLPDRERYGMWSQMTRAAVSIPTNIAEGHARRGPDAFANFLSVARGSLAELHTLVTLAERLGYAPGSEVAPIDDEIEQISRMLSALQHAIQNRANGEQ